MSRGQAQENSSNMFTILVAFGTVAEYFLITSWFNTIENAASLDNKTIRHAYDT